MVGSASGQGCSHSRSCPSRSHNSSAMCGAYGWISDTAVSAAKGAAGSSGAFTSSFTSSITAAIGVLNCWRRPRSSLTRAIVWCVFRAKAPAPGALPRGSSATSTTTRQRRRRKRWIPSTPDGVHSMSWSAGPMNRIERRVGSAP